MAIPPTAIKLPRTLDPSDIKDVVLNCALVLQSGEKIASYTLNLSTSAIAAGMEFMSGGGRDPQLINGETAVRVWPAIDPLEALNPIFDGSGIALDAELTIVTDSVSSRTDQQTFLIQWAQK